MKIKQYLEVGAYGLFKAHKEDAGFDICTPVNFIVCPHDNIIINTGIHIQIPVGYVGMIKSKSGLNVKCDLLTEGVIDALYTGSIVVKIYNHGNKPMEFKPGDKITQLVILPIPEIEIDVVDSLEEFEKSERGSNGFGSSGK